VPVHRRSHPAQQWDEFTADVWTEIIPADFTLDECRAAVVIIKRRQQWVDPSAIVAEVRLARRHAAEAEHLHVLLDPFAYRTEIVKAADAALEAKRAAFAAEDAAIVAKIAARADRPERRLRAISPPDYDGPEPT
jgi:hypothetical protein